jgi:hypothetical protein
MMNMKKLYVIVLVFSTFLFFSCEEPVDVDSKLNFPPSVLDVEPKDASNVVLGNYSLKAVFVDGAKSPLASGTLTLKDADGNVITTLTEALSGTRDSITIAPEVFDPTGLGEGSFTLFITAVDEDDQSMETKVTFKVVNSLYTSNQSEMYVAGAFNGWGADAMELVANNTWEIKDIDLEGTPFKLKNTTDWTDQDWGDSNCDGVMEITTGGGPNTECDYSGLVTVRFNDQTLAYTIIPAVTYNKNVANLYLLGSFNSFQGPTPKFTLTANNTWEIAEFRLKGGDVFKFSEGPYFEGKNFGDAEFDKTAEAFGPNIVLPNGFADAFYKITFNDATLAYDLILVRYPFPNVLYLVGGSTSAGWVPGNSIPFKKTGDGKFEIYAYLTAGGGGFKFLQTQDWPGDWGKGADGVIVQEGENNVEVSSDGFYRISIDFTNSSYNVQQMNWGIIGSGRTGDDSGWNADTDMTFVGGLGSYKWTKTMTLFNGQIKFRANDGWDVNFGDIGANGSLEYGGDNINVTAGTYVIEFILDPVNGYTYSITPD